MNKDEKFVMEKLRLYNETLEEEIEVSEEFKNRLSQIKLEPAPKPAEQKTKTKKIAFFSVVSTVAAALIVTLCLVFIPGKSSDPIKYNDENLENTIISYSEFTATHKVLLPQTDLSNTEFDVYHDKNSKKLVYSSYTTFLDENLLEVSIVFVNNYTLANSEDFENLDKTGSNDLISYSYSVTPDKNIAYAKFEHGGYKYFLTFTSKNPEDITEVLGGLKLNK
ncbi:hypothetical protein [Pumilibacter intestinalis]|uniref:hypothetical protein n=1 Tax=Pumilibacter intestinalis TaxID=2941511 RepID=UPI00203B97C5|nr:hypothetical protein [Pumilibacter intestinalis]